MFVKYVRFFIRDYLFALLSAIFLICYWVSARKLPMAAIQYPLVISAITVVFVLWNIYCSVVNFKKVEHLYIGDKQFDIGFKLTKAKLVVIFATIAYVIAIVYLGFVVSTFVYLLSTAYYLGARKPLPVFVFAAGLTAFFYVVFRIALAVRLPAGILI